MEIKKKAIEQASYITGVALRPVRYLAQSLADRNPLATVGQENLAELSTSPYILVANHLTPDCSDFEKQIAISPDGLFLERAIRETTGQNLGLVAKCDAGFWFDGLKKQKAQRVVQPISEYLIEGIGMIPVRKNPGSFNRRFLEVCDKYIKDDNPILIMPEGKWVEEFGHEEIKSGAAHLALKYGIPLVPAWITRTKGLFTRQEVKVVFGKPFEPNKTKAELNAQIRESILALSPNNNCS